VPFNITILNVELKAGELELIFLKSHPPEATHAGFPFPPFCILAIVPDGCALAIDTTLANVIIITRPTPTIRIIGLAIKASLFFWVITILLILIVYKVSSTLVERYISQLIGFFLSGS
jgi:hypothetical protein